MKLKWSNVNGSEFNYKITVKNGDDLNTALIFLNYTDAQDVLELHGISNEVSKFILRFFNVKHEK